MIGRRFLGLTVLFAGLLGVFSVLTLAALDRPRMALGSLVAGLAVASLGVWMLARLPAGGGRGQGVRPVGRGLLLGGLLAVAPGAIALAQDLPPAPEGEDADPYRTHFSSFDIGFGGVFPDDARAGISYGVGVDAANLFIKGASLRFAFRFWSSEATADDGRPVDLDDTTISLVVKKSFGGTGFHGYAGLGPGFHFINARFQEFIDEKEERDGFRPGLDAVLGAELPMYDRGFISLFLEGLGSLVSGVSHVSVHLGFRIRFDRLGTGG